MPVPSSINDLSTTASSNSPSGGDSPSDGDDYIRALSAFVATLRDKLNGTANTGTVKNAAFSGTSSGTILGATLESPAFSGTASGTLSGVVMSAPTLNGAVTFGEGWSLDTSGRLRNTSNEQPHFFARRVSNQTSGTQVVFNEEVTDQGGIYNNSTGVFTAPVAGVYMLSATVSIRNNSGADASTALLMTGSTAGVIGGVPLLHATLTTERCVFNVVSRLAANETVTFTLESGAGFSSSGLFVAHTSFAATNNYFSGALLF